MSASLTIVGMGACGVAAFAELVDRLSTDPVDGLAIALIERDDMLGRGLAFGTDQPGHLLNTESRLMGLYPHEPDHFRGWLAARRAAAGAPIAEEGVDYAPRREYGVYLRDVLDDACARARRAGLSVTVHRSEAIAIEGGRDEATVMLADGSAIAGSHILLTLGTPKPDRFTELDGRPGYFDFPWPAGRLRDGIDPADDVLVLGSSLSAIDTLATLLDEGHRGHIRFASPDGLLPRVEIPAVEEPYPRRHFTLAAMRALIRARGPRFSIVDMVRLFRREAEEAAGGPIDWHGEDRIGSPALDLLPGDIAAAERGDEPFQRILTSARFEASEMWDLLGPRDRRRFRRWLAPHFSAARFTMPIVNARRIAAAAASGQLTVHGGIEKTDWDAEANGFVARFADGSVLRVPVVVNATGTAMRLGDMPDPLIRRLAARGWLHAHPDGGIAAHRLSGQVITRDRDGPRLWAVGQLVNGVQRDTNAVWFNVACAARAVQDMLIKIRSEPA